MAAHVLGVDVGNSNTVFGLFEDTADGCRILHHWRTVTRRDRTSDELGIFLLGFLESMHIDPASIGGAIYSSVVPSFNPIVERMVRDYFDAEALRVDHESPLPIAVHYERPFEIGADRLVNATAAVALYGEAGAPAAGGNGSPDLICVDLGTATTFCVIHDRAFVGGSIAPGLKLAMETLSNRAAQLPPIEFRRPPSGVVGDSTIHALQAGFFFGWRGLLREIVEEVRRSEPKRTYRVVATGGLSTTFHAEAPGLFDYVDPLLTLKGLQIIYRFRKNG